MNIGLTIRKLRREKELTQETLAEYLGVSVSAVSQWEAEKTAPDLSLIPPLCNILGVSADTLLGIDLEAKQKRISEITDKAGSYESRGYLIEANRILTEGLREFPDSFEIMFFLMYNCLSLSSDFSCSDKQRKEYTNEAVRIAEFVLEKCTDDSKRHSAIQVLCIIYPEIGKNQQAEKLAQSMPPMALSREMMLSLIHTGSKRYQCEKSLTDNLIQHLSNYINCNTIGDNGEPYYTEDEMSELRDKRIAFLWLMFEDGDMGFYHTHLSFTHINQAVYYSLKKDEINTISHLKKACKHSIEFVKYATEGEPVYTSLLLRGHSEYTSFSTDISENDAMILLKHMDSEKYDFIREKPEFSEIIEELKPYARKWDVKN